MITPQEFYDTTVGRAWDIDHAYGVQCHDLAQKLCVDLDIPTIVIWCGNTGYAHDIWDRREISGIKKYFDVITDYRQLQNGDMVIFPTTYAGTPLSHVCFFYKFKGVKYAYGQRQGGNREARLITTLDFSRMAGAFRPKVWAGGQDMNYGKHKGCDVSQFQNPDTTDISAYEYVIIRAGYTNVVDPYLDKWVKKCEAEGKPYWFYWYSYATSTAWALTEAETFVNTIKKYNPTMGLWLDMEDADHYKQKKWGYLDQKLITEITETFLTKVAEYGLYTGVYASESWFGSLIRNTDTVKRFDKWVASWGNNDGNINRDTHTMGTMLQYTSHGGLDKDITYIDLSVYDINKGKKPQEQEPAITDDERKELEELRKENNALKTLLQKIKDLFSL